MLKAIKSTWEIRKLDHYLGQLEQLVIRNLNVHIPVLLKEVMQVLDPKPGEVIVDGTVGGGGYGEAIAARLDREGVYIGMDLDPMALAEAKPRILGSAGGKPRVILEHANFSQIDRILERYGVSADGVVLDLGFSTDQLERRGRGFSFNRDEPLLMTYDDSQTPVREILKTVGEDELAGILRDLGGERYARRIAAAIKRQEARSPIVTSGELARTVADAIPRRYERGRIHPATRVFLALRIYANQELHNLETFLAVFPKVMRSGGRVVIVTFQSLEDRLVKVSFRDLVKGGRATAVSKKPIIPSMEEVKKNPRARSAKMRAIQMSVERLAYSG